MTPNDSWRRLAHWLRGRADCQRAIKVDFVRPATDYPDRRNWTTQQRPDAAPAARGRYQALADIEQSVARCSFEIAKQYLALLAPDTVGTPETKADMVSSAGAATVPFSTGIGAYSRGGGHVGEASAAHFRSSGDMGEKSISQSLLSAASFGACRTNLVAQDTLVTAQKTQVKVVEQQFQSGASDRLDVLSASLELNATRLTRLDAVVKLQQALGALEDAIQQPLDIPNAIFESGIHPRSE